MASKQKSNFSDSSGIHTDQKNSKSYFSSYEKDNMLFIDWKPLFQELETHKMKLKAESSLIFHSLVADSAIKMLEYALSKYKSNNIVLSGGVFMNKILSQLISEKTASMGLKLYIHRETSPNDASISIGQAAIALNHQH
jgi:hydrogenase maturation protein HypF